MSNNKKKWVPGIWYPYFPLIKRTNLCADPVRIKAQKVIQRLTNAKWDVPGVEDWEWALEEIIVEIFKNGTEEQEKDSQQ